MLTSILCIYIWISISVFKLKNTKKQKQNNYIWMQVLLLEALKANICDYVSLRVLLDRGVNLKMINLPELYEQVNLLFKF